MKKDLKIEPVTGVHLAVVRKKNLEGSFDWFVYMINKNFIELNTILITSKGYGSINGEEKKTSLLRHSIKELQEQSIALVESIDPSVFQLNNEYWVSYYILDKIFDKKFVFLSHTITEENIRYIPELDMEGVLHS
ncbi:hypothetical protein ACFCT7_09325 [Fulvivirgaceae bacterium LMO-SS25]